MSSTPSNWRRYWYFISIVYIDHLGWGSHREEAKRGPPSGHRITRNGAAMVSLLLPYAPVCAHRVVPHRWVVCDRCNPWGQPRTPVLGTFRRPFMGRPVPRQCMRNALLDLTTIVPATAYHRRSYAERYSRYSRNELKKKRFFGNLRYSRLCSYIIDL